MIFFDAMIKYILCNRKTNLVVIESSIRGRKLNIVFMKQSYFAAPKKFRRTSTHYFINKSSKQTRASRNHI